MRQDYRVRFGPEGGVEARRHEIPRKLESQRMRRVLIITVEHQSSAPTTRMTESLQRINTDGVSLLIVRNGSIRGSGGKTCPPYEPAGGVWIQESTTNRGYFGGAKQGLEWFQKARGDLPTWIIVCNNDIRLEQIDFFERLRRLEASDVGVIAPRILSCRNGLNQNPFMVRRPGRRGVGELGFWLSNYHLAFAREKMSEWKRTGVSLKQRLLQKSLEGAGPKPMAIYAPHGSFLIFSKQFFARGGYLDDGFFLFHEEISVAEICRKIGLSVIYDPGLCVLHDEHSTTGRRFTRVIYQYQRQSFQHLTTNYLTDLVG